MHKATVLALASALAFGGASAIAQTPAAPEIPAAKCEPKPVYPGVKAIQDDDKREKFTQILRSYQECVKAYVAERKAFVEASNTAIRNIVEEHNAIMNKVREDQEEAKKSLGQ